MHTPLDHLHKKQCERHIEVFQHAHVVSCMEWRVKWHWYVLTVGVGLGDKEDKGGELGNRDGNQEGQSKDICF